MPTLDEYFLVVTWQKIVTFQWTRDLDMPSILTRAKADLSSSFLARKTMFYFPHTPSTSPQLIYFPFLILLFIFNLYPWPYIYRTSTPHRPYMDPTLTLPLTFFFPPPPPPPRFLLFPSSTTTTTFLLFSFHHRHHHISIVFPPLPAPPHFYCFLSTTATTTLLLFALHHHHISIVFPPQPPPPHFHCCLPPPSPPPHFYCFPSTTTTATCTFLLFSFHHQITLQRGGKTIEMWR